MAHVLDVAHYILERQGQITTLKLQKLVYYAQAWAIAKHGQPMFSDTIKAWAQGPVVPALFHEHKGRASVRASDIPGTAAGLSDPDRAHVDQVLEDYGSLPAAHLSELTHHEAPWKQARESGVRDGHDSPAISVGAIHGFYADKTPEQLEADFQLHVARAIMDEHAESLARLAL